MIDLLCPDARRKRIAAYLPGVAQTAEDRSLSSTVCGAPAPRVRVLEDRPDVTVPHGDEDLGTVLVPPPGTVPQVRTWSTRQVALAADYQIRPHQGSCSAMQLWQQKLGLRPVGPGSRYRYTFPQALAVYIGAKFHPSAGGDPAASRAALEVASYIADGHTTGWVFARPGLIVEAATAEELLPKVDALGWPDSTGTWLDLDLLATQLRDRLEDA